MEIRDKQQPKGDVKNSSVTNHKTKNRHLPPRKVLQGLKILDPPTFRAVTTAILVITASQRSADPTKSNHGSNKSLN